MSQPIEEILDANHCCSCEKPTPSSEKIISESSITDGSFTWIRFYENKAIFCISCKKLIKLNHKYLNNEIIFFSSIPDSFDIRNLTPNLIFLLNKFKNQNQMFYSTLIKLLKSDFYEVLMFIWKNGLIKLHRKKISPRLTTPVELKSEITGPLKENIIRNGTRINKISLTENGQKLLEAELKWDIDQLIKESNIKIHNFIDNKVNNTKGLLINNKDLRIDKILDLLQNKDLINGRIITLNRYKFDLIRNFNDCSFFIELLLSVTLKISQKKTYSIKDFTKGQTFVPNNIRNVLGRIFNVPLLLFNIFREPFGNESENDVLFDELQNFILNEFESKVTLFIIDEIKKNTPLNQIWLNRIPIQVKKEIEDNFRNRHRKILQKPSFQVKTEFQDLINKSEIDELISYTLFSSIPKLITETSNWSDIFRKIYSNFSTAQEFQEEFKKLNLLRVLVAHKKVRKIDLIKFLKITGHELSDILEKFYIIFYK